MCWPRRAADSPGRAFGHRREEGATALTDTLKPRVYGELVPLIPQLKRSSPPERAKTLREALERAGACPTWEEWDAYAEEVLGDDAGHVRSDTLRP